MKCNWLLQTDVWEENLEPLKRAIISQGMKYIDVEYKPFNSMNDLYSHFHKSDCVVTYGSLGLVGQVFSKTAWVPGAYCNLKHFECSYYYPHYLKYLLNNCYVILPYASLFEQQLDLYDWLGIDDTLFVRPNSGYKQFNGQLIYAEKFVPTIEKWNIGPSTLIVVSSPKNLMREWRLVVVNQQIIAASRYYNCGDIDLEEGCPNEVLEYGQQIANVWEPDICWTMDICEIGNNKLKLIEINSFSCSGLYLCNKDKVVEAVSKAALEEWNDITQFPFSLYSP